MKNQIIVALAVVMLACVVSSCHKKVYLPVATTEESGLNLQKITDETNNTVLSNGVVSGQASNPVFFLGGTNKENGVRWGVVRTLAISPDGEELAYMTKVKNKSNINVRSTGGSNATTQRTSRNVGSFCWGVDNNLYFGDLTDEEISSLCSVDAHAGTFMRQLTHSNYDTHPMLSPDGKKLFFTRYDSKSGPTVWNYDMSNGRLTSCAAGYQPAGISPNGDEFICVRNSDKGNSEIWQVNYVSGREVKILGDNNRSYTHPAVSPDGQWLLVTGNSKSTINKEKNLDIFALKLDGSNTFLQLTYHPGNDTNPQWSADGRTIYFISDRANKDRYFNVWRMNFNDPTAGRSYNRPASTQTPTPTPKKDNSKSKVYPL